MTAAGWMFLSCGWGIVMGLTLWCLYRISTAPEE